MTKTPETTKTAIAHGNYIRGSASKVRRVLDQIRGRSYRDALIMLEFMPYRSTDPITKVLRSCLLYTSPSPRDGLLSRMPSSA